MHKISGQKFGTDSVFMQVIDCVFSLKNRIHENRKSRHLSHVLWHTFVFRPNLSIKNVICSKIALMKAFNFW